MPFISLRFLLFFCTVHLMLYGFRVLSYTHQMYIPKTSSAHYFSSAIPYFLLSNNSSLHPILLVGTSLLLHCISNMNEMETINFLRLTFTKENHGAKDDSLLSGSHPSLISSLVCVELVCWRSLQLLLTIPLEFLSFLSQLAEKATVIESIFWIFPHMVFSPWWAQTR